MVPLIDVSVTIITLYISTILAIVKSEYALQRVCDWLHCRHPCFLSLLYLIWERCLSKKKFKAGKYGIHEFPDNSHKLRPAIERREQRVYGMVKSILSMDHNADLYNGMVSDFLPR